MLCLLNLINTYKRIDLFRSNWQYSKTKLRSNSLLVVSLPPVHQFGLIQFAMVTSKDLTGVEDNEYPHDQHHQAAVENIGEVLMTLKKSRRSLDVLNDSIETTDHNQDTGKVQNSHVARPIKGAPHSSRGWVIRHSFVEYDGYDHEKAKENNLNNETDDDNIFSKFQLARGLGTGHYCTTWKRVSQIEDKFGEGT